MTVRQFPFSIHCNNRSRVFQESPIKHTYFDCWSFIIGNKSTTTEQKQLLLCFWLWNAQGGFNTQVYQGSMGLTSKAIMGHKGVSYAFMVRALHYRPNCKQPQMDKVLDSSTWVRVQIPLVKMYSVRAQPHQNPLAPDLRIPPMLFNENAADFRHLRI